jgi:hypothetical protein
MKFDKVTIIKIASLALSVLGMIGTSWATDKENERTLKKLVEAQAETQE